MNETYTLPNDMNISDVHVHLVLAFDALVERADTIDNAKHLAISYDLLSHLLKAIQ